MDEEEVASEWYAEQADAAERETRDTLLAIGAGLGPRADVHVVTENVGPIEDLVQEIWEAINADEVCSCDHLDSPRTVWMIYSERPRIVRCESCHLLAIQASVGMSRVCDVCKTEEADYTALVSSRYVVLTFRSCQKCKEETGV